MECERRNFIKIFFKPNIYIPILSIFSFTSAIGLSNPYPAILCVDAVDYWDGPYTVEISPTNNLGQTFASIYDQAEEGRFLIDKVNVERKVDDKQITFIGENFKLEMDLQTLNLKEKTPANITFKYDGNLVNGAYSCIFF